MLDSLNLDFLKLRIRQFDYGGNTFRVLMPLEGEFNEILKRMKEPNEALQERVRLKNTGDLDDESIKKAAGTLSYILDTWSLLCNENGEKPLVTLDELERLIPFQVQFGVAQEVMKIFQPDWEDTRKN